MKILVTNDDGIHAPGIKALWQALKDLGNIVVVAPDRERSAMSHCITVHHPLRVEEMNFEGVSRAWAVDGTPADCVKLGIQALLKKKPDLVVAGINRGANLGTDVLYSGTVSAAIEGIINGCPAVAFSLAGDKLDDYEAAAIYARRVVEKLFSKGLTVDTLINVNVPSLSFEDIKGVTVTKLGTRRYENTFIPRQDPRGKTYFWMGGEIAEEDNDADTDVEAVKRGEVSITPIHFDLTNYGIIEEVKKWNL